MARPVASGGRQAGSSRVPSPQEKAWPSSVHATACASPARLPIADGDNAAALLGPRTPAVRTAHGPEAGEVKYVDGNILTGQYLG